MQRRTSPPTPRRGRSSPHLIARPINALVAGFSVAEDAVAEHLAPLAGAAPDPLSAALLSLQQTDEARTHASSRG